MVQFWKDTNWLSRICLGVVSAALVVQIGSWFGLTARGPFQFVYLLHLAVLLLGFVLFLMMGYHHVLAIRTHTPSWVRPDLPPLPGRVYLYLVLLTFDLILMAALSVDYSSSEARVLGVFSAGWMWFGLFEAISFDRLLRRIQWYRGCRISPAA